MEKEKYQPILQKFERFLSQIQLWNEDYKSALDHFSWEIDDGEFVYSTTTGLEASFSKLSPIALRPLVMGFAAANKSGSSTNWLACELLMESEDLRSLRMWRYYPTTFKLIRQLAELLFVQFNESVIYFTDEAQDAQDFESLRQQTPAAKWKFDYALIPSACKHIYSSPPETHLVYEHEHYDEAFFVDKWELKDLDLLIKAS